MVVELLDEVVHVAHVEVDLVRQREELRHTEERPLLRLRPPRQRRQEPAAVGSRVNAPSEGSEATELRVTRALMLTKRSLLIPDSP